MTREDIDKGNVGETFISGQVLWRITQETNRKSAQPDQYLKENPVKDGSSN